MNLLTRIDLLVPMAAGGHILASVVPEIWKNLLDPAGAKGQNPKRAVLQATGNALWAIHGAIQGDQRLTLVTSIGCVLRLVQLGMIHRAKRLSAFWRRWPGSNARPALFPL